MSNIVFFALGFLMLLCMHSTANDDELSSNAIHSYSHRHFHRLRTPHSRRQNFLIWLRRSSFTCRTRQCQEWLASVSSSILNMLQVCDVRLSRSGKFLPRNLVYLLHHKTSIVMAAMLGMSAPTTRLPWVHRTCVQPQYRCTVAASAF